MPDATPPLPRSPLTLRAFKALVAAIPDEYDDRTVVSLADRFHDPYLTQRKALFFVGGWHEE